MPGSSVHGGQVRTVGFRSVNTDVKLKNRCLNISKLTNNTNFTEVREFVGYRPHTYEEKRMSGGGEYKWTNSILIRFVFITRAWNKYVNEEMF